MGFLMPSGGGGQDNSAAEKQIAMQNNQLRYLLSSTNSDFSQRGTSTTVLSEGTSSTAFAPNHLGLARTPLPEGQRLDLARRARCN